MGKGVIVAPAGEGKYYVDLEKDVSRIKAKKNVLLQKKEEAENRLTEIDANEIADKESEVAAKRAELDTLIAAIDGTPETVEAVATACTELAELNGELANLTDERDRLTLEIQAIEKDIDVLDSVDQYERVEIWCVDYTTDLDGTVATIEIPGVTDQVNIRPGYSGGHVYNAVRDGILQPALAGTPSSVLYNLAMQPGWKRWAPFYRMAKILSVDTDNDICTIKIDEEAEGQFLDFNYPISRPTIDDVPIEYMICDGEIFEVGDHVIVEFDRQAVASGVADLQPERVWWKNNVKVIGFVDNPKPCTLPGSFLFCPCSDTAPYGWGDPYESGGTPINPPLGTVLSWPSGEEYCIDGTKHSNRLWDGKKNLLTHGSEARCGARWWRYRNYVISWDGPVHMEVADGSQSCSIWRNGYRLAYGPEGSSPLEPFFPYQIAAAAIRDIGGTTYLYVLNEFGTTLYRAPVDPLGIDQVLNWINTTIDSNAFNGWTLPWGGGLDYADFNPECTKLVISAAGRRIEIDIEQWGNFSVLEDTWFQSTASYSEPSDSEIQSSITVPISSGYLQTGARADIDVVIDSYAKSGGVTYFKAKIWWNRSIVKEMFLFFVRSTQPRVEERFLNVQTEYTCPKTGVIYINWQDTKYANYSFNLTGTAKHYHEIYKGSRLIDSRSEIIDHWDIANVGDPSFNACDTFVPSVFWFRDASVYPQYSSYGPCERYLWWSPSVPGTSENDMVQLIAAEVIGAFYDADQPLDQIPAVEAKGSRLMDQDRGGLVNPSVSYSRKAALSTHPQGAFAFSIAVATGVTETDEEFEWWNVYHGVPDLLDETDAVGDNQRLVPACGQAVYRYRERKIGVYYAHPDNPWS